MTVRHSIGAAAIIIGGLLLLSGLVTTPQATSVSCTQGGTAGQGGNAAVQTGTPECTTETQLASGQQRYLVGLGLTSMALGAGIGLGDVFLDQL